MSTFALFTAGLAAMTPFVAAYTQPQGDSPSGNAISQPGLNSVVPAGQAFTITWEPSTKGKVSLLLCKGPSTNCVITSTIADSIENSGTYAWTPSTDLAPSQPTGYGIELVVEGTGEYQYSTQFGISNPSYSGSQSSSSAASSAASSAVSSASSVVEPSSSVVASTPAASGASSIATSSLSAESTSSSGPAVTVKGNFVVNQDTPTDTSSDKATSTSGATSGTAIAAQTANGTTTSSAVVASSTGNLVFGTGHIGHFTSGWGFANSSDIKATGSHAASSSLKTSTISSSRTSSAAASAVSASATQSGAASAFGASFGGLAVAAGIAVFAL